MRRRDYTNVTTRTCWLGWVPMVLEFLSLARRLFWAGRRSCPLTHSRSVKNFVSLDFSVAEGGRMKSSDVRVAQLSKIIPKLILQPIVFIEVKDFM